MLATLNHHLLSSGCARLCRSRKKNLRQVTLPPKMGFWYMNVLVTEGRDHSERGSTMWKGERACQGEGLGVLHSLLNLIPWASTPTPMASITSSFLQNPYFSSPNLFFQLQTPRSNIQQNDSESSGSNYPKLHSSSLLTYTCSWWVRPDSDQIPHISIPSQQLAPIAATC